MNIDNLLDIERRTGVSNSDIDDFMNKVTQVQDTIQGLLEGKVNPDDVKIPGFETPEEIAKKEKIRQQKLEERRKKDEQLMLQRKKEEHLRWWEGAELFAKKSASENIAGDIDEANEDIRVKTMKRYTANYSRWEQWIPDDPASRHEEEVRLKEEEQRRNEEFEKNNAEFCNQYMNDMKQREEALKKKQDSADVSRIKGNNAFKKKDFSLALSHYMESLKVMPYDVKTLTNIAQVHIKLESYEDAMEYLKRTLYLDPDHVKALSRKAHVESATGHNELALNTIRVALRLEPNNTDIINQHKELDAIASEKETEAKLLSSLSKSQPVALAFNPISFIDWLRGYMDRKLQLLRKESQNKLEDCMMPISEFPNDVVTYMKKHNPNSHPEDLAKFMYTQCKDNKSTKIYCRTCGVLEIILKYVSSVHLRINAESSVDMKIHKHLSNWMHLLAVVIEGERSNILMALEEGVLAIAKNIVCRSSVDSKESQNSSLALLLAALTDSTCTKSRNFVLNDKSVLHSCGLIVGELTSRVASPSPSQAKSVEVIFDKILLTSSIQSCAEIIKIFAFSDNGKKCIAPESASVVMSLGFALRNLKSLQVKELTDTLLDALLGLSQYEALRQSFGMSFPLMDDANSTTSTVVHEIVSTLQTSNNPKASVALNLYPGTSLAILMNISIGDDDLIRQLICDAGGLDIALSSLRQSGAQRQKEDPDVLVRKAGMLSRLATLAASQRILSEPITYRMLCKAIASFHKAADKELEPWEESERGHLIRVLASVVKPNEECRREALAEKVTQALVAIYPIPRMELGEVTPSSVILPPHTKASALLLGNLTRCLLHFADDPQHSVIIFDDRKLLGVEKLISAMATCSDIKVRKNIAIVLAKGCRSPSVRQKVTNLRGMQMLIELQDQL